MQLEFLFLKEKFYAVMLLGSLGWSSSQQQNCVLCFSDQRPKGPSKLSPATDAKADVYHGGAAVQMA